MQKKRLLFLLIFLFGNIIYSQSIYHLKQNIAIDRSLHKEFSPPQPETTIVYDISNYFTAGLMSYNLKYPGKLKLADFNQTGFYLGSRKNSSNIDELVLSDLLGLHFNIGGENTFGFATGKNYVQYADLTQDTLKHYTATVNLYSANINAELIVKIPLVERRIIGGVALTFFNIGGSATYMKSGRYGEKFFGSVDLIPFYIQPYVKLALKNATFGIGMFVNPYSFAEYRFGPSDIVGDDSGIFLNSAQFTRYAMMFFVYFK